MIYCINCNSINVEVTSMDFARRKMEGQASAKADSIPKNRFMCMDCSSNWNSDPEAYQHYFEYANLIPRTTFVAQTMGPGGTYNAQYINPDELDRREELAKIILDKYRSYLDIGPVEWYNIELDAQ